MNDYSREWSGNRNIRYTTDPNFAMGAREGKVARLRTPHPRRSVRSRTGRAARRRADSVAAPNAADPERHERPIGVGSLDRVAAASADGPRDGQSRLAASLRPRLVATVDDFGTTGEAPTHPELLDWLAAELVDNDWSMKQLIRTIVLSRTYRLASTGLAANDAVDPNNMLYWRQNLRALELEPLRDSMLFVGGRLDESRPYGVQVTGHGGKQPNKSLLSFHDPYRTIYLPVMRSLVPDIYGMFDFPDPTQIRGLRDVTTVAPQALFLMNDRFAVDCADGAAEQLLAANLDDAAIGATSLSANLRATTDGGGNPSGVAVPQRLATRRRRARRQRLSLDDVRAGADVGRRISIREVN